MAKRYDDAVEVVVSGTDPAAFRWRGRRYPVDRVLKHWREAGESWDPVRARDEDCYRVASGSGTYDLRFSRAPGPARWRLSKVWD